MQARFTLAVLLGVVLLAAAACSSGGDDERIAELETDLAAEQEARQEAEAQAAEAELKRQKEEAARIKAEAEAETAAEEAADEIEEAKDDAAEAEQLRQEEEEKRQAAERRAQEQIQQQAQTLLASQRAERLSTVLDGISGDASGFPSSSSVIVTVPGKGRLTLKTGGKTATLAGAGIRSSTFALTQGGNPVKRYVYTDRELTRQLLAHYGMSHDPNDSTRLDISHADLDTATITNGTIEETSKSWDITHGVKTSLDGVDHDSDTATDKQRPANPANPEPKPKYSGKLHGVPGTFVCGGDTCQIQLTPRYEGSENDVGDSFDLESVSLANDGGTDLFFKPTNPAATISLYEGGPVGVDGEYMVFGYWLETPNSAVATPDFGVFAKAHNLTDSQAVPANITASYDGTAVGVYAEKDPNEALDTWRQGEFTAAAYLKVNGAADGITGTIRNFTTKPIGGSSQPVTLGRWVVTLEASNRVDLEWLVGTAAVDGEGNWKHEYVQAHATAADDVPPAVVGAFEAEIVNLLHIVGAFGAHKQ